MMFEYEIAGKKYYQKPLVLGQVKQLARLLKDISFTGEAISAADVLELIGDKLPEALAIVLIPEGCRLSEKNIKEIAQELEESLDLETAAKIIEDFFCCNPISSFWKRIQNAIQGQSKEV